MTNLPTPTDGGTNLKNVRVLVLDDEEPIRKLAYVILSRAGCIVETASDGREGLHILLQRDFDVVVLDLRMHDLGGSAFLEEARSIWPWIGIVILTGNADPQSIEHAGRFGVSRLLEKPLKKEVLIRMVMEEAAVKRQRLEMTATQNLDRIQDQLGILRRFGEIAMAAESLDEAMWNLCMGVSNLFPCSCVGVLSKDEEKHMLFLAPVKSVAQEYLSAVEHRMLNRYMALTGLHEEPHHLSMILGRASTEPDAERAVGHVFTVPVVTEGKCSGLLALAAAGTHAFSAVDVNFLYHAANNLSTVMTALTRMRQLSVRDALTGMFNRRGLEEEYERAWSLSRRYNYAIGVAVIDVDHFKTLNDTHGHPAGDQILREFSSLVKKVARATDIIGRYGGDEMVVILPQAGAADGITFGERLVEAVRGHIFLEKTKGLKLTCSVGVASTSDRADAAEEMSSATLLSSADQALYMAKRQGRDRVCIFQPEFKAQMEEEARALPAVEVRRDQKVRARVLVVDDEPSVSLVLARILQARNYEVCTEESAPAAIKTLKSKPGYFDVIITDLSMPEISGLELLDQLRSIDDAIMKIVITGHATLDNALTSLRRGAYDFIQKPVLANQLLAVLDRALDYARLKAENRRYQLHLEDMVREKSAALKQALDDIKDSYDFTLEALTALLDARETSTGQHSIRVRRLAVVLAREMGLSESEIDVISHGALLHDIGKIAIPDSILLKPGPLTPEEREVMRTHPEVGYRVLSSSKYLEKAAEIVLQHQESFDGSGYPAKLQGEQICMGARIFALVDTYDAMRSDRVYRKAMPPEEAVKEILRHSGTQFDPQVVAAFRRCQEEFERVGAWNKTS